MRRVVPIDLVVTLWKQGLTDSQIAKQIGPVNGTRFDARSINAAICRERKKRFIPYKYAREK